MRCLLFGILAFCPLSDGASLTWKEPPPSQVVQEAKDPVEHFSSRKLFEGTINATLRWCFNLTGLHFQSCAILFGGNTVALISSSVIGTPPSYAKRFGFDWIPNQHLMKLFIFNVSMKDSGTFSCRVTADSLDRFSEFHFKSHVQVDVVGTTSTQSTRASTIAEQEGTTSTPSTTASTIDEREGTTRTPSTTASTIDERKGSASTPRAIIGGATGGVALLAIGGGVLTWWVHKQRKRRRDFKIHNFDLERQNPSMPAVSISPQPLPAIKKGDPYEKTYYADIPSSLEEMPLCLQMTVMETLE